MALLSDAKSRAWVASSPDSLQKTLPSLDCLASFVHCSLQRCLACMTPKRATGDEVRR